VDDLNFNLLSVNKLYDNGYHITFDSNAYNLIDSSTNKLLYQGKRDKSVHYCLPLKIFKDEAVGQLRININDKS
jgi:hypothetical protein